MSWYMAWHGILHVMVYGSLILVAKGSLSLCYPTILSSPQFVNLNFGESNPTVANCRNEGQAIVENVGNCRRQKEGEIIV